MCLVKIINHYPVKSSLYKFYKEHCEAMFEDLYEPFSKVVEGTNLEEEFESWWDSAAVKDILRLFSYSGLVVTNLTENDIKDIQMDYDGESLSISDYLEEVFLRGWFEIKIEPHNFFKYFTKMKAKA